MASANSKSAAHCGPTLAGYSKTSRRQYQSCDQCRKSRRACDAGTLRVATLPLLDEGESSDFLVSACNACSNCARTSKTCTFDWLRSLPLEGLPKGVKRKLVSTAASDSLATSADSSLDSTSQSLNRHGASQHSSSILAFAASSNEHVPRQSHGNFRVYDPSKYTNTAPRQNQHLTQPDLLYYQHMDGRTGAASVQARTTAPSSSRPVVLPGDAAPREMSNVPVLACGDLSSSSSSWSSDSNHSPKSSSQSQPSHASISPDFGSDNHSSSHSPLKKGKYMAQAEYSDITSVDISPSTSTHARRPPNSSFRPSNDRRHGSSPLSPRQVRFADGALKTMIATGLLRIYHDSFENSLACWVTEKNCPYESELLHLGVYSTPEATAEGAACRPSKNRIFSRVSRLDLAFARLRGRELTSSENRSASKALNAAIMAFASQWSHDSHSTFRTGNEGGFQTGAWQNAPKVASSPSNHPTDRLLSGECERMIQKTLWHEARTAIRDSAEIDSFKVILAYMIFALTQRPIDEDHKLAPASQSSGIDVPTGSRRGSDNSSSEDSNIRRGSDDSVSAHESPPNVAGPAMDTTVTEDWDPFHASDLEALNSPPVYLETAVRNLFVWRRKIGRYRRLQPTIQAADAHGSVGALALKDQQTFNILFWLGVMCDTSSSAITRRPLVIPDEDCAMIRENVNPVPLDDDVKRARTDNETGELWGDYLLGFKWAGPRKTVPRWPCNPHEAALVLQEAIPVKVLMFRKVAQLQTLAARRSQRAGLEKCIEEALTVYQHWNELYGPFMVDCVRHHDSLPSHIQSWYVLLDGHWHYGCLLLADTISQIDQEEKTMEPRRSLRATCHLIRELRTENAQAIANIVQASMSQEASSFANQSEFHFACSGSAILTEPWTDILVRALGSACKTFITRLASWDHPEDPMHSWVVSNTDRNELYSQAEICIQGMSLLGRKSDAANYTAEEFWTRLKLVCQHRRRSESSEDAQPFVEEWMPEPSHLAGPNPLLSAA